MIKNYFRILKKPHAYLQTILKTPVKFQKDRTETVGGVKGTKYLLKTWNHAPRTTRHAPRPTENQKQCPSTFLRKGGGQWTYQIVRLLSLNWIFSPKTSFLTTWLECFSNMIKIKSVIKNHVTYSNKKTHRQKMTLWTYSRAFSHWSSIALDKMTISIFFLTVTTLLGNSAEDKLIFFFIFQENKI